MNIFKAKIDNMELPSTLMNNREWVFLGPLPSFLTPSLQTLPTIAVDGGAKYNVSPTIWVGDADSFLGKVETPHQYVHPKEKDQSDLGLGLSLLKENNSYLLHFFGFLGGRHDHELFNFGEASSFLLNRKNSEVRFYNNRGEVLFRFLSPGDWSFEQHGIFSLGTLHESQITLSGDCQYQIPPKTSVHPLSSYGLSNQGHGKIHLQTSAPVFLYFPLEEK